MYAIRSYYVNPGDEVVVAEPCYVSYQPLVELCDTRLVRLDTAPTGFVPTAEAIERMIVITSYSIHYTKLYDQGERGACRTVPRGADTKRSTVPPRQPRRRGSIWPEAPRRWPRTRRWSREFPCSGRSEGRTSSGNSRFPCEARSVPSSKYRRYGPVPGDTRLPPAWPTGWRSPARPRRGK